MQLYSYRYILDGNIWETTLTLESLYRCTWYCEATWPALAACWAGRPWPASGQHMIRGLRLQLITFTFISWSIFKIPLFTGVQTWTYHALLWAVRFEWVTWQIYVIRMIVGKYVQFGRYKIDLLMQRKQSPYCEVHFFNLNSKSNIQPVYNFLVHYYIYLLSHLWPYGGMSPIVRSKWDLPRGEGHWIVCTHEG